MPVSKIPSKSLVQKNLDSANKLSVDGPPTTSMDNESAQAKKTSPEASDGDTVSMQMISNRTSAMQEIESDEVRVTNST